MSRFILDHVTRLMNRKLLAVYDEHMGASVHTTPTVFFDAPFETPAQGACDDSEEHAFPAGLLEERKRRLDAHLYVREWYLITESGSTEYTEELRGDYGVLIFQVDDVAAARRALA